MYKLLLIALGGGIGSVLRFLIASNIGKLFGQAFFWGTLSVNLIGSFLIGIAWALFESNLEHDNFRLFIMIGLLGGFTTFSAFSLESLNLFRSGEIKTAISYILLSNLGGISLAFLGFYIVKLFIQK